jgi:hypothetical protein
MSIGDQDRVMRLAREYLRSNIDGNLVDFLRERVYALEDQLKDAEEALEYYASFNTYDRREEEHYAYRAQLYFETHKKDEHLK